MIFLAYFNCKSRDAVVFFRSPISVKYGNRLLYSVTLVLPRLARYHSDPVITYFQLGWLNLIENINKNKIPHPVIGHVRHSLRKSSRTK